MLILWRSKLNCVDGLVLHKFAERLERIIGMFESCLFGNQSGSPKYQ